jgi:translation initiation factor IF-3
MSSDKQGPRINEDIRAREVRVIVDGTGEQLGIIPTTQALALAQERGLDLVEIADNVRPPVCKVMDYGAYKFKRAKELRKAKKAATKVETKEMHFTTRIADHDLQVKARKIKEFLENGDRVFLAVEFKGREKAHPDIGRQLITKVLDILGDAAHIEVAPKYEGGTLSVLVLPKK